MKFLKYALIVLFSVGMMSCGSSGGGDKEDTVAPTVTIASPTLSTTVAAGENLSVNFTATDNVGLSSYSLLVAYSGTKSVKTVEEFVFDSATGTNADGGALPSISGTSSLVSFSMFIEDNAKPGMYKMTIKITDSANNTSSSKEVIFEIL